MSKGHIIYMNDASKAVDYFKTIGYECPPQTNPADFFMSMMSIEAMDVQDGDDDQVQRSKTMIEEQYDQKVSSKFKSNMYRSKNFAENMKKANLETTLTKYILKHKYSINL